MGTYVPPVAPDDEWRARLDDALARVIATTRARSEAEAQHEAAREELRIAELAIFASLPNFYNLSGERTNPWGDVWSIPAHRSRVRAEEALNQARTDSELYRNAVDAVNRATGNTWGKAADALEARRDYEATRRAYLAWAATQKG